MAGEAVLLVIEGSGPVIPWRSLLYAVGLLLGLLACPILAFALLPLVARVPWLGDGARAGAVALGTAALLLATGAYLLRPRRLVWSRVEVWPEGLHVVRRQGVEHRLRWEEVMGYSLADGSCVRLFLNDAPRALALDDVEAPLAVAPDAIACRTQRQEVRVRLTALLDERGIPRLA